MGDTQESSMEAYKAALGFSPDYVEMDVVMTSNGELICFHPKGKIPGFDLETIPPVESLDFDFIMNKYPDTPIFEEVIQLLKGKTKFFIDLKIADIKIVQKIVGLMRNYSIQESDILFGTRSNQLEKEIHTNYSKIKTLALWETPDSYPEFFKLGGYAFRLKEEDMTKQRIANIQNLGGLVWAVPKTPGQGINRPTGEITLDRLRKFKLLGIDGVVFNNLELLRKL